jgi:alpha-amylase
MRKVAEKCYLPANNTMLEIIKEYGKKFKIAYSISGVCLDQFELYAPDVLESFIKLAKTGCVEFLGETYSHSLSSLKSKEEFQNQVNAHSEKIKKLFNVTPKIFRNTELIYSDEIGSMVSDMGFKGMLTEGAKHILGWKSPNYLYTNAINPKLLLLLKNFRLSDDIAFRFSNRAWSEWPLTADKYVLWLNSINPKEEIINLFMDYETFGEHQWAETGIFHFLKDLPRKLFALSNFEFLTPSEVIQKHQPIAPIHVPFPISWADEERDLTAWLGNELQNDAFNKLYELINKVEQIDDPDIQRDWKYLQTSDHFYYMCTKWFSDGDVHKYFNPYNSPYEAFINYMNILSDFEIRVNSFLEKKSYNKPTSSTQKSDETISEKPKSEKKHSKQKTTKTKTTSKNKTVALKSTKKKSTSNSKNKEKKIKTAQTTSKSTKTKKNK